MVDLETPPPNAARRISRWINRKPASNLLHAINLADRLGLTLNIHVSVNLQLTSCAPSAASKAFERLRRNHFAPWLRRLDDGPLTTPCAYVWVLENRGGHIGLHWLLHMPAINLPAFKDRLPHWLASVGAAEPQPGAIHVSRAATPRGLGRYMLKGINPAYAPFYKIEAVDQGNVTGRRSGFSRNLGPTARAAMRAAQQYPNTTLWPKTADNRVGDGQ